MRSFRPILFTIVPVGQKLVRGVTLYENTWFDHIIVGHPELIDRLEMVEMTIAVPTTIYESSSVAGSLLFYRSGMVDDAGRFLRVVVGTDRSVKSAYFTSEHGGKQRWP